MHILFSINSYAHSVQKKKTPMLFVALSKTISHSSPSPHNILLSEKYAKCNEGETTDFFF